MFDAFLFSEIVRTLILISLLSCASGVALGQSAQPGPSPRPSPQPATDSQNAIVDPKTTSADIAKLPLNVKWARPRLTMQRALKISERYLRRQRISISAYFLSEARLIDYGGDRTPHELRWFFRWIASDRSSIEITVSMTGKPSRAPSM